MTVGTYLAAVLLTTSFYDSARTYTSFFTITRFQIFHAPTLLTCHAFPQSLLDHCYSATMNISGDPLDWSVEQVVDALCKSTAWWTEGRPNSKLPDPTPLEKTLFDEEIDGYSLLTYFNSEQKLKDDLGLKTIGRVSAVSWAIDKLREQSPKYVEYLSTQRTISAGISVARSILGSTAQSVAGSQSLHARPVPSWLKSLPLPSDHLRLGLTTPLHETPLPTVPEAEEGIDECADEHTTRSTEIAVGSVKRPGETLVQGADGKKRRKLILTETPATQNAQVKTIFRSIRKRFPVDKIFYGESQFGQVLEDDDDLDFQHHGEVPHHIGSYVYRQYLHFVRNPERKELSQDGRKIIAIHPYRSNILAKNEPRSATVVESTDNGAKATRQNTLRLQSSIRYDSSVPYEDEESHALYALAERWTKDDDEVLPALGDSDNEEYSSSYEAELEAEERERALQEMKRDRLSKEEISTIIQERIQELTEIWKRKKLPLHERKARTLWRKGRHRQGRQMLRTGAAEKAKRIDKRLSKLCEAIADEEWHKTEDVLRQCATLEESISQREEELWRVSVWDLTVEPAAPPATVPRRTAKKSEEHDDRTLGEEAGDWVDSDSELESDGLEDFVEIDEDIKDTSPEMTPAVTARQSVKRSGDVKCDLDEDSMPDASHDGPLGAEDSDIDMTGAQTTEFETAGSAPMTPKHPRRAKPDSVPRSAHSVIDLTALSDGSMPSSPTPVRRLASLKPSNRCGSQSVTILSRTDPENSTFADVSGWDFSLLQERNDKKRLVLKIVRTVMAPKEYGLTQRYATSRSKKTQREEMWQAIEALYTGEKMAGMPPDEWHSLVRFARLYACWKMVNQKHWSSHLDKLSAVLSKIVQKQDKSRDPAFHRDLEAFIAFTNTIFEKFPSQAADSFSAGKYTYVFEILLFLLYFHQVANQNLGPSSDDEDHPLEPADTPHKKRKNKVEQSASAIGLRKSAQKRAEAQEEIQREFQERVSSSQSKSDNLIVNPGEYGKDGAIYIHPSVGERIKSHQIEGIRFMWREIVEAGIVEPQGCLLAHTMGLGKTMQAITLLITIAEAAKSSDEEIRSQIPDHLRHLQILILCPATLVDNWIEELYMWIPKSVSEKIGRIRKINAENELPKRLTKIRNWGQKGGILVVSYEMFRSLFGEKQASKIPDEERHSLEQSLLKGPSLIIADEAHKMKNSSSSLRNLVERFESKSRVALTGSPLANNLVEYWSMIDWVSPGYLGSLKEFKANFVEPIEDGLYKDSSKYEHRKALKKLRVLKNEIGPKINRADITVLKDDLKPKVEFLITVPLTSLQEDLYNLCIQHFLAKRQEKVTNTRLWQWMNLLNTLCIHPIAFFNHLKNTQIQQEKGKHGDAEESEANDLQDTSPDEHGPTLDPRQDLPPALIEEAMSLCNQAKDHDSPYHSFKTSILMEILGKSKEAGDRVLVFSHHIATLDYLENLLAMEKYRFVRLDGKTRMPNRPKLLDRFNRGDYDLFLISTKAGGTGFNLPGANRVIVLDFGFNPQNEEQAIGRAYRLGQEKEVFVYRMLTGGTFEPKVWNKALFKTQLASRVVDKRNPERHAEKMKDYFFEPGVVEQEDLTEHQGKDKKVLDRILMTKAQGKDSGVRAITTTETLMTEDLDAVLNDQETEEVKKMIEAERLRKEDPKAYEQYLRNNPAIDDSRNNPAFSLQRALINDSSTRHGLPPTPLDQSPHLAAKNYVEFGPSASNTAPAHNSKPAQETTFRLDGLPSSDAGINNAGPSPASMRRQDQLKSTPRKAEPPVKETVEPLGEAQEPASSKKAQEIKFQDRRGSPELGDEPLSDPGVNNSGPALPGARPLSIPLISSSPAPKPNPLKETESQSTSTIQRHQSSDRFMSSTRADHNPMGDKPVRSVSSPLKKEVRNSQISDFRNEWKIRIANDTALADETDIPKGRKPEPEKVPDSHKQKANRPSWLPEAYAVFKRQET